MASFRPKILYAIQGTGNGHVARARDIIPLLEKYADVDILLSSNNSEVQLPRKPDIRVGGLSFKYNRHGGLSYLKTIFNTHIFRLIKEIRQLKVSEYDLVISDFECVSAWACKLAKMDCLALGHQASFISPKSPRPKSKSYLGEWILKYYAPCKRYLGFHFHSYAQNIHTPVIRKEIRSLKVTTKDHFTVYLPAFSRSELQDIFQHTSGRWEIFSKDVYAPEIFKNIIWRPIDGNSFAQSMASSKGVICSAGFETPAEALYLGKKLMVVPIKGQYEQLCNAAALKQMGVMVLITLTNKSGPIIDEWLEKGEVLQIDYPDVTGELIKKSVIDPLMEFSGLNISLS